MSDLIVSLPTQWNTGQKRIAMGLWWMLASVSVAIWISGNISLYQELHQICGASPPDCAARRLLTYDNIARLQAMGLSTEAYIAFIMTCFNLGASACLVLGLLIFLQKANYRNAWFAALFLVMYGGSGNVTHTKALTDAISTLWLPIEMVSLLNQFLFVMFFITFPNGRFAPRWTIGIALGWVIVFSLPRFLPNSPLNWNHWPGWVIVMILTSIYGSLGGVMAYRYRHVLTRTERQKTKWVFLGMLVALIGILFQLTFYIFDPALLIMAISPLFFVQAFIVTVSLSLIPISIAIAILRSNLFDIDFLINRTLVYSALTVFVAGAYILVVGAVGALLRIEGNIALSLVATGLVAVAFNPLRERLQRFVNRLMYGDRDEPYRVLTRLGQRLESVIEPATALALTVETVAHALKLPYVAIRLKGKADVVSVGNTDFSNHLPVIFPLIYAGKTIGELVATARAPDELLSSADQRLLGDLARQIGVTAHAIQLGMELEHARLRIVTAREEARRRLGSDLHDGLGHQLTGLARQAEMATALLEHDPAKARGMLVEVTEQLNTAISQVRGMAHQLHPPELELLGLVGALRERVQIQNSFAIRITVQDSLPPLPTAIETAAYYIALEALTNVEKHADAKWCAIRIALIESHPPILELDVTDDGRGLPPETAHGLGLLSMQARAVEIGGMCRIEANPGVGTRVSVRLPCLIE